MTNRRQFLKLLATSFAGVGIIALGWLRPVRAAEWNKSAFDSKALTDALANIGAKTLSESDQIVLRAPEIAENGAIVPVEVESKIPGTQSIYILADKNPQPLAASFDFSEAMEPFVALRIKMSESSNVRVVVKTAGGFFETVKEVKVTIGGCGG
jgi:sulfur-oxidizing protein SoxY